MVRPQHLKTPIRAHLVDGSRPRGNYLISFSFLCYGCCSYCGFGDGKRPTVQDYKSEEPPTVHCQPSDIVFERNWQLSSTIRSKRYTLRTFAALNCPYQDTSCRREQAHRGNYLISFSFLCYGCCLYCGFRDYVRPYEASTSLCDNDYELLFTRR